MEPVVTAVVPSFRGAGHLDALLARLLPVLRDIGGELVLVDDCSDDETWEVMKKAASNCSLVTCMRLARSSGQQAAVLAGCTLAGGRWIVTLDDDLEHDPSHITRLISLGDAGYDLVYAVPEHRAGSGGLSGYVRRAGSMFFDLAFTVFIGKPMGLKLTSFRAMRVSLVRNMLKARASAVYVSALALRQHPRICSVTVEPGKPAATRTSLGRLVTTFAETILYYGPLGRLLRQPRVTNLLPIAEVFPERLPAAFSGCDLIGVSGAGGGKSAVAGKGGKSGAVL